MRGLLHLIRFVQERFAVAATLPLAAALVLGPLCTHAASAMDGVRGILVAWLTLLALRIADDLADLDVDRLLGRQRGLCLGTIDARALRRMLPGLFALVLALTPTWPHALLTVITAGYYVLYYRLLKSRLSMAWRSVGQLVVFGILPLDTVLARGSYPSAADFLLAGFILISTIAHEWAHDIHAAHERPSDAPSLANAYGPRRAAELAAILYGGAFIVGLGYWHLARAAWPFALVLAGSMGHLGFLLARLILEPTEAAARPLYVAGMTFWILPILVLAAAALAF